MDLSRKIKTLVIGVLTVFAALTGACSSSQTHSLPGRVSPDEPAAAESLNAEPTAELVTQGRKFFAQSCAHCHGVDARGDEGPDLHNLPISDERMAAIIKNGIKGEMPAFAQKYQDPEIASLQAYVRSLK